MKTVLKWVGFVCLGLAVLLAGAYLALRRPDIPFKTLEAKYANSASRYLDLPSGAHVHYRDQGNPTGPVLVLVHGFSASLHTWEPWVGLLGNQYRIISLDLPGHGLTRAPADYKPSIEAYASSASTAKVAVTVVYQDSPLGLGHAISCARNAVGQEPFAVMLPDEIMGDSSLMKSLIALYDRTGTSSIGLKKVPRSEVSSYGNVEIAGRKDVATSESAVAITRVIEKP
jgi:hypothetical protein